MNFRDFFTILIELLGRHDKNDSELSKALKIYEEDRKSLYSSFELESAFKRRYGKYLPAKKIFLLSKVKWGPKKTFDIYSFSSFALGYNFVNEKFVINPVVDMEKNSKIKFSVWVMAVLFAIFPVVLVCNLVYISQMLWGVLTKTDQFDTYNTLYAIFFSVSILSIVFVLFIMFYFLLELLKAKRISNETRELIKILKEEHAQLFLD